MNRSKLNTKGNLMKADIESLSHAKWDCMYHLVFVPKCRRNILYDNLRQELGEIFHQLAAQRASEIIEGRCCVDHVHMLIRIPPQYATSQVVGYTSNGETLYVFKGLEFQRRQGLEFGGVVFAAVTYAFVDRRTK